MLEGLGIVNKATGSNYPVEIHEETAEPQNDQNGFGMENENKDIEIKQEDASIEPEILEGNIQISNTQDEMQPAPVLDEQDRALSTMPADQVTQLKGISQELLNSIKEGPSSIIDQDVIGLLQKLPTEHQLTWWEMVLSPRQAIAQLNAEGEERKAKSTIRASVATTALTVAEYAEQDLKSKIFRSFVGQLRKTYDIELFCRENGLDVPEEGSLQESHLLLQNHFAWLAQAKRQVEIQKQIELYVAEKVRLQGEIAMAKMRTELLPALIQANLQKDTGISEVKARELPALIKAREEEFPLQRKATGQKAGHYVGMATTAIFAGLAGGVVGVFGGVAIGSAEVIGWTARRLEEVKAKASEAMDELKARIEESKARKNQSKGQKK